MLIFRDQDIGPAQHVEFARRFGELEVRPVYPNHNEHAELVVATKNSVQLGMTLERANRVIIQMDAGTVRTAGVLALLAGEFTPPPRS